MHYCKIIAILATDILPKTKKAYEKELLCVLALMGVMSNYVMAQNGCNTLLKDDSIRDFCMRNKVDANKDGRISLDEAEATTKLSLMNFRNFMRNVRSYEDLQYFPNLEYFHAGFSFVRTVDVSCCPKLKELDVSDCQMLRKIVLAEGCNPEIKYPAAYKGVQAKLIYKK